MVSISPLDFTLRWVSTTDGLPVGVGVDRVDGMAVDVPEGVVETAATVVEDDEDDDDIT